MKKNILERDGIFLDDTENTVTPSSKICYRCNYLNGFDYQACQKCGYPLSQEALNRIKEKEDEKINKYMLEMLKSRFEIWLRNHKDKIITDSRMEVVAEIHKGKKPVVVEQQIHISDIELLTKFKEYYQDEISDEQLKVLNIKDEILFVPKLVKKGFDAEDLKNSRLGKFTQDSLNKVSGLEIVKNKKGKSVLIDESGWYLNVS